MSIFTDIENFVTTKVWPFLKNIGKSTVQAEIHVLQPIAVTLVSQVESKFVQAAASGDYDSLGDALSNLVKDTITQAKEQSIAVGVTSVLASIGTALATNATTATNLAVAPK